MVVIAVDVGGCAGRGSCTARASAITNGQRKQAAQAVHRHTSHTERCVMATQRHSLHVLGKRSEGGSLGAESTCRQQYHITLLYCSLLFLLT